MNGLIKNAFIFVLGAGVGALGSAYFFMKRAEKAIDAREDAIRADYEDLYALYTAKENYSSPNLENSSGEKNVEKSAPHTKEPTDYTRFSKPDLNDVIKRAEEKLANEANPMEEDEPVSKLKGPRVIKSSEFGQDRSLDIEDLYYFTDDDVLANEDDEEIDDDTMVYMIGDGLDKFNYRTNNERYRYVRNERYGKDYRIEKIRGSFRTG